MKIPKWQHELARYYKRGKLISYFLNNAAKTCLYGLKISKNIEIGDFFQSRTFFHLSSNFTQVALAPLIDTPSSEYFDLFFFHQILGCNGVLADFCKLGVLC